MQCDVLSEELSFISVFGCQLGTLLLLWIGRQKCNFVENWTKLHGDSMNAFSTNWWKVYLRTHRRNETQGFIY